MTYVSGIGSFSNIPIIDWFTLYAQHSGTSTNTLPFTAKYDEAQTTSATQYQVLTRRLHPDSLVSVVSSREYTTTSTGDNTTLVNGIKFFLDESFAATLTIVKSVRFRTVIQLKSSNASGTAYLQRVIFKLRALTANDTYRDLAEKTVTVNASTTSTSYVNEAVIGVVKIDTDQALTTGEKLVLEITTDGKGSSGSYTTYHNILFTAGSSETYVEFGV